MYLTDRSSSDVRRALGLSSEYKEGILFSTYATLVSSVTKGRSHLLIEYWRVCCQFFAPRPEGHFGIARSVRLSVPWRSCLGYRHIVCLQLSHRRPPEMCGLRTCPQMDVDPPQFLDGTAIGRGISSRPPPWWYLVGLWNSAASIVSA